MVCKIGLKRRIDITNKGTGRRMNPAWLDGEVWWRVGVSAPPPPLCQSPGSGPTQQRCWNLRMEKEIFIRSLWRYLFIVYNTKNMYIKSTTVYVPRRNWDSPNPSLASECAPPPRTGGRGAHSPAGAGLGASQFRRLEKMLSTLPTLWCTVFVE